VTTTTTTAPITVVAAPITTNVNTSNTTNNSSSTSTSGVAPVAAAPAATVRRTASTRRGRLELDLVGCGRRPVRSGRVTRTQTRLRLPLGTTLVVRVNGHRVGTLDLDGGRGAKARPLPLRVRLRPDGTLAVYRPSGRVLATQACIAT
jgi:hypothetical protein